MNACSLDRLCRSSDSAILPRCCISDAAVNEYCESLTYMFLLGILSGAFGKCVDENHGRSIGAVRDKSAPTVSPGSSECTTKREPCWLLAICGEVLLNGDQACPAVAGLTLQVP